MDFGEFVRKRRIELGMTITQLSKITGINQSYLSTLERNTKKIVPSENKIDSISRVLRLPKKELKEKASIIKVFSKSFTRNASREDLKYADAFYSTIKDRGLSIKDAYKIFKKSLVGIDVK